MPGFVDVASGAPKAVGGLGLTHSAATGTSVRAVDAAGLPLTGYTTADGMAPAIEGWDGLVLSRRNAADSASQILHAYTDIASCSDLRTSDVVLENIADLGSDYLRTKRPLGSHYLRMSAH